MPSLDWINLLEQITELRKTLVTFTSLLKDMIKDTDRQPDKEIHRVKSGRALNARDSIPVELGSVTLLVNLFTNPEGLQMP